jgi:hypothetical protein
MFYVVRDPDNRIVVASPTDDLSVEAGFTLIESVDDSAYTDISQVWRLVDGVVEIDPTYTPPEFDLSRAELRAILKLIVDQFNVLREAAGMSEITYTQAKTVIKDELGL